MRTAQKAREQTQKALTKATHAQIETLLNEIDATIRDEANCAGFKCFYPLHTSIVQSVRDELVRILTNEAHNYAVEQALDGLQISWE